MVLSQIFIFMISLLAGVVAKTIPKVVVIGGGAAGYFAGIECARRLKEENINAHVSILELSKTPLSKVLISGGGRCNVMHDPIKGAKVISQGYPRGEKELLGPYLSRFGPAETYDWFSSRVELKTEDDGRVFPVSDKSSSIIDALRKAAEDVDVKVLCRSNVRCLEVIPSTIEGRDEKFKVTYSLREKSEQKEFNIESDRVIFATGSSSAGQRMMESLGHKLISPAPSLFSFKIKDENLIEMAGLAVGEAEVKLVTTKQFRQENKDVVKSNDMKKLTQSGAVLITHQGLSGPGILRLSAYGARVLKRMNYSFDIEINWIPTLTSADILEHLEKTKRNFPQRSVTKVFPRVELALEDWELNMMEPEDIARKGSIPKRLWNYICVRNDVGTDRTWGQLKRDCIAKLAREICSCRMEVSGRGLYRDEFVTAGGVSTKEVDFASMQSKVVPGLYMCGEVLDIDGVTGGYNFQSAWTTGYLAGRNCADSLGKMIYCDR
jgi:predicted Rossmann fold flavoprotein